ncbi:hypothetical protein [Granulicella mallensis]|uniref:Uncharacterized protein n=1 Tax=Granulicella mallensis TaxID=940614 RepID=A0A7W8EAA8_9BACT|nr:hypothetical protein [Granulicella mallensis]MBB5063245.1 hypothetical protein [Granulicella mallensis]
MADTSDRLNPPRRVFHWLRHPFLLIVLGLLLYWGCSFLYHLVVPRPIAAVSPANPNGEWIGELTMDGRRWEPSLQGDTPGPHRHAILRFRLEDADSFMDTHHGPGTMIILGEGITRTFRAINWESHPDGSIRFGIDATPDVVLSEFSCEADGNILTCKTGDPLEHRLTLRPGTDADANALLHRVEQQAANEPSLPPLATAPSVSDFERELHRQEQEDDQEEQNEDNSAASPHHAQTKHRPH